MAKKETSKKAWAEAVKISEPHLALSEYVTLSYTAFLKALAEAYDEGVKEGRKTTESH